MQRKGAAEERDRHPCHKMLFTPDREGSDKLKEGSARVHLLDDIHLVANRDMAVPIGLNCQPDTTQNHRERGFPLRNCLEQVGLWVCLWGSP